MVDMPYGARQRTEDTQGERHEAGPMRYFAVPLLLSGVLTILQGVAGIAKDRLYGVPRTTSTGSTSPVGAGSILSSASRW